jgi:hypothetical protein
VTAEVILALLAAISGPAKAQIAVVSAKRRAKHVLASMDYQTRELMLDGAK